MLEKMQTFRCKNLGGKDVERLLRIKTMLNVSNPEVKNSEKLEVEQNKQATFDQYGYILGNE